MRRLQKKHWVIPWIFKSSALLQINAVLLIIFFLVQTTKGTPLQRFMYIATHEWQVTLAWISSMIAILSIAGTFSVFTYLFYHSDRIILQCSWFISIIGTVIAILNHFVQITIIPLLSSQLIAYPSGPFMQLMSKWDSLLSMLITLIIPSCFAISGLIYSAVLFRAKIFSNTLRWWSFSLWSILLLGVILFRAIDQVYWLYAGFTLFFYVPWLWKIGNTFASN